METALAALAATSGLVLRFEINLKKTARDKRTGGFVNTRLEVLEQYWQHYLTTYLKFMQLPGAASSAYETDDNFTAVQECYLESKSILHSWKPANPNPPERIAAAAPVTMTSNLPKLEVPKFSGEFQEWETFRDLFRSIVHDHEGLTPAVKLQYLKTSVSGEAEQLLRNIAITDANYADAWNSLVDRFDNPRSLVRNYVRALLTIPAAGKESAAGIKKLLDATNESVRALRNLRQPVQEWDAILVELTCQRLDPQSRRDWETSLDDSRQFPTWAQLSTFLETRARALDAARSAMPPSPNNPAPQRSTKPQKSNVSSHTVSTPPAEPTKKKGRKCSLCSEPHYLGACPQYKALDISQREEQVRRLRLCRNCLGQGHLAAACPSTKTCSVCGAQHHTTLHLNDRSSASTKEETPPPLERQPATSATASTSLLHANHASMSPPRTKTVLLGTALVILTSESGRRAPARILIDPCSEGTFASEAKAQALRATRTPVIVPVSGVAGAKAGVSRGLISVVISSRTNPSVRIPVVACVLPRVTGDLPSRVVPKTRWDYIGDLPLADPEFDKPGKIDMILGADVYRDLLLQGVRFGPPGTPLAQETIFGWILTGSVSTDPNIKAISPDLHVHHVQVDLSGLVQKFWELEELPGQTHFTEEEEKCENLFRKTYRRDETGRYVVRLPLRKDAGSHLGESHAFARRALLRGERRRASEPQLEAEYSHFLSEYLSMGHMEPVTVATESSDSPRYYMPHHAVVRAVNGASKLRIVFNASHPTSSGASLNDILLPGPKLQTDISSILMRWRRHRVVFAADIVKMFRQIRVAPEDCDLQRIVWRESPSNPVQDYRLLTVTYGTACAPYLAIRTLQQLADDEANQFPEAAYVLRHDTYVDDTLTGADDLSSARKLKGSLTTLLKHGGFELSKWMSNTPELLLESSGDEASSPPTRTFECHEWVRTLGVIWTPTDDSFRVQLHLDNNNTSATKRSLLSELARTFDPLGWIAPVLITAKILFQDTWLSGVSWDEPLPPELLTPWLQLRTSLPRLEDLAIPRGLGPTTHPRQYQLHGFSDASERAYAATVYVRATSNDGTTTVSLLCVKTKVAPVKSVSLPRLELCGAVLLARLMTRVKEALKDDIGEEMFAWSDSTVTLAWIRGHPSRWVTFVANRVAEIHTLLPTATWQHVKSADNPADLATRGITPEHLLQAELWWQGPGWLKQPQPDWPRRPLASVETTDQEVRVQRHVLTARITEENDLLSRYSTLKRLLRITAWCLRFRQRNHGELGKTPRDLRPLCASEIAAARQRWIIISQDEAFRDEITALRKHSSPLRSALAKLNPFLDDRGVLRVGGRLHSAELSYEERHPAILPQSSKFTELIIRQAHEATLHGGTQLTTSYLRRFCWIIGGRKPVRSVIHRCVECARHRASIPQQQMGQLPAARITRPKRPFERTGLDYAGPFLLRANAGRGRTTFKAYIALFVCLATRAIHLEVVGSYTTEAFLAAFKRFTARRGICAELHSDNGTNFRGADQELRKMFHAASTTSREIASALADDGTRWHFIPPGAPHFGGIWEAGVKSTKYHLRRVIGETIMSYEEFATVVAQIEGCLNSRPICPLSEDPSDLVALTPGHFLTGGAPTAPPEPSVEHLPRDRLNRWQLTTQMVEIFWRRWSSEYLNHLQQRMKWLAAKGNISVGDLVLIRDKLRPPAKWPLARVTATHPGPDGLTRVVTVQTATSSYRRPIVKLVVLPVRDSNDTPDEAVSTDSTK